MQEAMTIDGLRWYGPALGTPRSPLLAFTVDGVDPVRLAEGLNLEGVEARAGCHCATLAHRDLGLTPPASCRLSFALYTSPDDVARAMDAVRRVVRDLRPLVAAHASRAAAAGPAVVAAEAQPVVHPAGHVVVRVHAQGDDLVAAVERPRVAAGGHRRTRARDRGTPGRSRWTPARARRASSSMCAAHATSRSPSRTPNQATTPGSSTVALCRGLARASSAVTSSSRSASTGSTRTSGAGGAVRGQHPLPVVADAGHDAGREAGRQQGERAERHRDAADVPGQPRAARAAGPPPTAGSATHREVVGASAASAGPRPRRSSSPQPRSGRRRVDHPADERVAAARGHQLVVRRERTDRHQWVPMPIRSCSRRSGPGAHQFHSPSSVMVAGTSSIRTSVASIATATHQRDAGLLDHQHLGGHQPGEHDDHEQRRGRDDPAGPLQAGGHRLVVRQPEVVLLLDPGQQEHLVVHRQAEPEGQHQRRDGRLDAPGRGEGQQPLQVPVARTPRRPRRARRRARSGSSAGP